VTRACRADLRELHNLRRLLSKSILGTTAEATALDKRQTLSVLQDISPMNRQEIQRMPSRTVRPLMGTNEQDQKSRPERDEEHATSKRMHWREPSFQRKNVFSAIEAAYRAAAEELTIRAHSDIHDAGGVDKAVPLRLADISRE
jgi:hypothetical protein